MLNKFLEGEYTKLVKVYNQTADTAFAALQLQYTGNKTYSKVQVLATGGVKFWADDTDGATTVDPNIGIDSAGAATTDGVISLAAPHTSVDTIYELVAHINSMADYRAFLCGALADFKTLNTLDTKGATSIATDNGLTLYFDEDTVTSNNASEGILGFSITNEKFTSRPTGGWSTKSVGWVKNEESLVINSLCYMEATITQANDTITKIYSCNDRDGTETLMYSSVLTSATKTTYGATNPMDVFIQSKPGERLCIVFDNESTESITAAVINAIGTSMHITGGETVGGNYSGLV